MVLCYLLSHESEDNKHSSTQFAVIIINHIDGNKSWKEQPYYEPQVHGTYNYSV